MIKHYVLRYRLFQKHRVLIPEKRYLEHSRVSIAFFCQPDNNQCIETLDGSGKYPPVTAGGWLTDRFQATYDVGNVNNLEVTVDTN